MGLASEEPPVISMASRWPSASSMRANSTLSGTSNPPFTPSSRLILAVTAMWAGAALADRGHDLAGEAGPVLQAAGPVVLAAVELRAQERRQQVVVGEVDLDGVEAGLGHERRPAGVVHGDPLDLGLGDRSGHLHRDRVDLPRRRQRRHAVLGGVGHRPGVAELAGDEGALVVDGVDQPTQAGHRGRPQPDAPVVGAALGGDRPGRRPWSCRHRPAPGAGGSR